MHASLICFPNNVTNTMYLNALNYNKTFGAFGNIRKYSAGRMSSSRKD